MNLRGRGGFTLLELLYVLLISIILFHVLARIGEVIGGVDGATRSGSDAGTLETTVERVLRRALESAGTGLPAAPNLAGVGVKPATGSGGAPADTLIVLQGDGAAMTVASRPCRTGAADCVALVGDHRARVREGDLILVGTRSTGLSALQVQGPPAVFYAPCAGDCPERLVCPVTPGPSPTFFRIVGSVRQPGGTTAPGPCPQAFFPDGSRCEEIEQLVTAGPRQEPSCRAQGPSAAFTELSVADRTTDLGFPSPPLALWQSGAGALPKVRAVRVRASRFWVRAEPGRDTVLVRQNSMTPAGEWRTPVAIAGPVHGLGVATLQEGVWTPATGAADLRPGAGNANYVWSAAPAASGREPAWRFRKGHHTIAAVRVRYTYRVASASQAQPLERQAWIIVPTRSLLQGGTGDAE
jgi:hypothetical protein